MGPLLALRYTRPQLLAPGAIPIPPGGGCTAFHALGQGLNFKRQALLQGHMIGPLVTRLTKPPASIPHRTITTADYALLYFPHSSP